MNDPFDHLRETGWRRKLTPAEAAELERKLTDPAARADWEAETALTEALEGMPEATVSTNFTSRVLLAVEIEQAAARREAEAARRKWFWRSFFPKTALATVFILMTVFSFREARLEKRQRLARSVAAVSGVASLPDPEILKDFDAIQQLDRSPGPDRELLALLQ
ncbi:MAG: hypothetical protein U1F65_06605 [Verrucomicrobiota bacterium]